jgi:hypothetical protein
LSSTEGQDSLRRILTAWVISNTGEQVYWQGLDSIAAPFLSLMFHDESLAYTCLTNFVVKYCNGFFLPDNSKMISR